MCKPPKVPKAPKPRDPDEDKPEWLRNPYLDGSIGQSSTVDQLRKGRSSLRIDLGGPAPAIAQPQPASPRVTTPLPSISPKPRPRAYRGYRGLQGIRTHLH
ncbi:hypothetical protein [Microbulbifer discodermiae]|uniref:hypothetical protein n=1 Tax=Microbulbifer sp. 2201CG32-9 TaxID=3232309 RepID=UPI00345BE0EE